MKKFFLKYVLMLGLVALVAAPAMAQVNATTNVNVQIPSMLVLFYRGTVTFDLTGTLEGVLLTGTNPNDEGGVTLTSLTDDAGTSGTNFAATDSLTAQVTSMWAVRSINTNDTRVTVTIPGDTATGPNSETITISTPLTKLSSSGTFSSNQIDFAPGGLGAAGLRVGDVQFDMDMSGVSTPGNFTGATIQISAQNL